jgi:hypothetical protein
MCGYLQEQAFPRVMARTGVVACHLFGADRSASYLPTAESSTREFDVPAWVLLCEASVANAAIDARKIIDDGRFSALGIRVRDDFAVYALEICRLRPLHIDELR